MSSDETFSRPPYDFFGDENIKEFDDSGSEGLLAIVKNDNNGPDSMIPEIFTELLLVYQETKLNLRQVTKFLNDAIKDDRIATEFINVFSSFPLKKNAMMKDLIKSVDRAKIIRSHVLISNLDKDFLLEIGLVKVDFVKKVKNGLKDELYTQKKYNLLHEESEGYAKLIVEVYTSMNSEDSSYQVEYIYKVIKQLIGHFNLDPNRVLDVILDIFANNFVKDYKFAIKLLKISQWWPAIPADNSSMETLSIGGNITAAKLIGMKIKNTSAGKDLPETLKILVAVLIKENFISFGSIYNNFSPNDTEMDKLNGAYKASMETKAFKATASALSLAAPLLDEEEGSKSTTGTARPSTKKEHDLLDTRSLATNTKYQFLKIFLGNGLYWPSIFMLTKYPFLAQIDDEISDLINRMMEFMVEPLYDAIKPVQNEDLAILSTPKKVAYSRSGNTVAHEDFAITNMLTFKPLMKSYGSKQFHYFYDRWCHDLPVAHDIKGLFDISKTFLRFSGAKLSRNLALFTKLCEIGANELTKDNSQENVEEWFQYFRNFIFPAMSLITENSFAIDSAFEILRLFPLENRYNLYGELHNVIAKNNPLIKIAYGKAEKQTKDVLKRLSKENVRPMMRRLAKISFSNPLPCFLTILQQIESYDNLNSLVVETARYFNLYGWDVLTLALLMRLTNGRNLIQKDGLNDRQWIQSLASFIGKICQRYPSSVDLNTLLDFILKTLHNKDSIGLIVLKEIFISMGGIQTITNLTLSQIEIMNSEPSLRKIVYNTIQDTRFVKFKSGAKLVSVLIELKGINELLILLCQLGDEIIYNDDSENHLKVLASKSDDLNQVLHLFTEVVNFFITDEKFALQMLPVGDLVSKYGVSPEWAFEIWRKYLNQLIVEGDLSNKLLNIENVTSIIPDYDWKFLTKELYFSFWQLSLYDINYSDKLYDDELLRLAGTISGLKDMIGMGYRDKEVTQAQIGKYKSELESAEAIQRDIPNEKLNHSDKSKITISRVEAKTAEWFAINDQESNLEIMKLQVQQFLQYCVLPRAIHSAFDAIFAAKFIFLLHSLKTKNFSIILLLNELINSKILFGTLFTLTPIEAENLGLFYAEILKFLGAWRDKSKFETDSDVSAVFESEDRSNITHNRFREILFGYHSNILNDVVDSLKTEEYMSRRNAITFLRNLLGIYPNVEGHCELILTAIENITNNDEREDLKLSSSALIGHVKSRSKEWVQIYDFYEMGEDAKNEIIKKKQDAIAEKENAIKLEKAKLAANGFPSAPGSASSTKSTLAMKIEQEKKVQQERLLASRESEISYDEPTEPIEPIAKEKEQVKEDQPTNGRVDPYKTGRDAQEIPGSYYPYDTRVSQDNRLTDSYSNENKSQRIERFGSNREVKDDRNGRLNSPRAKEPETRPRIADSRINDNLKATLNSTRGQKEIRENREKEFKERERDLKEKEAKEKEMKEKEAKEKEAKEKKEREETEAKEKALKEEKEKKEREAKEKELKDNETKEKELQEKAAENEGNAKQPKRRSISPLARRDSQHQQERPGMSTARSRNLENAAPPPPPPPRSHSNTPVGKPLVHPQRAQQTPIVRNNVPPPPPKKDIRQKTPLPPQSTIVPDAPAAPREYNNRDQFHRNHDRPSGPRDFKRKNDSGYRDNDKRQKY